MTQREYIKNSHMFVLHPHSSFRFYWDIVSIVILMVNVVTIPLGTHVYTGPDRYARFLTYHFRTFILFNENKRNTCENKDDHRRLVHFGYDAQLSHGNIPVPHKPVFIVRLQFIEFYSLQSLYSV